jgi:hypothetical protein
MWIRGAASSICGRSAVRMRRSSLLVVCQDYLSKQVGEYIFLNAAVLQSSQNPNISPEIQCMMQKDAIQKMTDETFALLKACIEKMRDVKTWPYI